MARPVELPFDREAVVDAAVALLVDDGYEALSMRSVAARLGVSPVPLYRRVGNREALLDAIAERLLTGAIPTVEPGEAWPAYADRWARSLRARLRSVPEFRKVIGSRRQAYVGATDPLVAALRVDGVERDDAVRSARLLLWSTVGFVTMEMGAVRSSTRHRARGRKPGGDPGGVTASDGEALFEEHLAYVLDGLVRTLTG